MYMEGLVISVVASLFSFSTLNSGRVQKSVDTTQKKGCWTLTEKDSKSRQDSRIP